LVRPPNGRPMWCTALWV